MKDLKQLSNLTAILLSSSSPPRTFMCPDQLRTQSCAPGRWGEGMKQDTFFPTFVFDLLSGGISWSLAAVGKVVDSPPPPRCACGHLYTHRADPLKFMRTFRVCQLGCHQGTGLPVCGSQLDSVHAAVFQAGDQSLSRQVFLFLSLPYIQTPLPACLPSFQPTEDFLKRQGRGQEHRQGKQSWV